MLRKSSSKKRSSPDSSEKFAANQNLARASPPGIFPKHASDSPNFSADPTIFRKNFGEKFGTEMLKNQVFKKSTNSANSSEINSTLKS